MLSQLSECVIINKLNIKTAKSYQLQTYSVTSPCSVHAGDVCA